MYNIKKNRYIRTYIYKLLEKLYYGCLKSKNHHFFDNVIKMK